MKELEPSLNSEEKSEEKNEEKSEKRRPLIGYYKFWVVLTYLSAISAVVGMVFALNSYIGLAMICLMICGLCDVLDGPAARRKKRNEREKSYGIQIDSLADLVSFGVFPVVIGFATGAGIIYQDQISFGLIMTIAVAAIYVLAALIRLAYYNVVEIELQSKKKKRKYYEGMPVTFVSILIPLVYSICLIVDVSLASVYPAMLFIIAVAFLTRVKIPKVRGKYLLVFLFIGLPIAIFLILSIGGRI